MDKGEIEIELNATWNLDRNNYNVEVKFSSLYFRKFPFILINS